MTPGISDSGPAVKIEPVHHASNPNDRERARLAAVYRDLQCHYRRNDRTGAQDVFDRYGYGNAATWAKRWEEVRSTNKEWAERVMADVLEAKCPVLRR